MASASYTVIDPPHAMLVIEDNEGKKTLIARDEDGEAITMHLTTDYMGLLAYHSALCYFEMTGERPHLPPGMFAEAPIAEPILGHVGEAPLGTGVFMQDTPAEAPAPRVRIRTPAPEAPAPRIRRRA